MGVVPAARPVTRQASPRSLDRALGALYGLAIGDALGMPMQGMARGQARRILGSPPGFREAPDGSVARGLPAGSITDDTMQAVIVGNLLVRGHGVIAPRELAHALSVWARELEAQGQADLLGPSTKRALAAVEAGADPLEAGRGGTTNGAAMRITPVGIANPLGRLVDAVVEADRVTHDTPIAHAGAGVVAAMVSCGVDDLGFDDAVAAAVEIAARFGFEDLFAEPSSARTGVETAESVPAAFAVARRHPDDAWAACVEAASLGGDTDTMAAIAGAMVGAHVGLRGLPPPAVELVRQVNGLESFEPLAASLLALRSR